jgi:hypothetical protein
VGVILPTFPSRKCPVDSTQPKGDAKQWVGTG